MFLCSLYFTWHDLNSVTITMLLSQTLCITMMALHYHLSNRLSSLSKIPLLPPKALDSCPKVYMLLSQIMLAMWFVRMLMKGAIDDGIIWALISFIGIGFTSSLLTFRVSNSRKTNNPSPKTTVDKTPVFSTKTKATRLMHLALMAAIARIHALPLLHTSSEHSLHKKMSKLCSFLGVIDTKQLSFTPDTLLRDYLVNEFTHKDELLPGCFSYIVDTGCSCSCSPHKDDFETLSPLPTPITLKGVAGDAICTHGGTISIQTINSKDDIVTLKTPGYYNHDQTVRLLSPQALFWIMSKKQGNLQFLWATSCLNLPGCGQLPLAIDHTTFLPLLTCFNNANEIGRASCRER